MRIQQETCQRMFWHIKNDISTNDEITLGILEDYEYFVNDFEPNYNKVKIYPDCLDIGYICPLNSYNGEYNFPPGFFDTEGHKISIKWSLNDNDLIYDNIEGHFTLYTLDYIFRKFAKPRRIKFNGEVALFHINTNETVTNYDGFKVIVYNIVNSKLVYHINKSLDYTSLWINCYKLANGNFTFTNINGRAFHSLLNENIFNFNINDNFDAYDVFEALYQNI